MKVDFQFWNNKYRKYFHSSSKFLAHDEENFTITGDKVVIKACRPISARKHYYVRNVVKAFPRNDYYDELAKKKDEALDEEYKKLLNQYMRTDFKNAFIKTKRQEAELKSALKAKALSKAMQNIKRMEAQKAEKLRAKAEAQAHAQNQAHPEEQAKSL